MSNCVRENPLRSREDVERAAIQLITPLVDLLSPGKAGCTWATPRRGLSG